MLRTLEIVTSIRNPGYRPFCSCSTSSKMLRISLLSGFRPIKIGSVNFGCKQSNWHLSILVLLNAGLHNNTISSCCALSKSLYPFAIRTIVLLAHAVQARKCYAFPRCRAFALSKSDLSIPPASSRIDISRFWYCSMLIHIISYLLPFLVQFCIIEILES